MVRKSLDDGMVLEFDERAFRIDSAASKASARTSRRRDDAFDETPELLEPRTSEDEGSARRLADSLVRNGVVARAGATIVIDSGPGAPVDSKRAFAPAAATRLTVPLADDEQAVVLVEGDGVLAWRFGRPAELPPDAQRRRGAKSASRALVFEIDIPPIAAPTAEPQQRGWLRDRLLEGARAIVLYFAADLAADAVVHLMERNRRNGAVVINSAIDAGQWLKPDNFAAVNLPANKPAKILLLVHGTFSSTIGGFGELTVTPWGQRLLTSALERYDAVLGFDHQSLALSPLQNAQDLLNALRSIKGSQPIEFDAICHSRGGLVLRTLTERLLPPVGVKMSFKRAIFVAATNNGTELARPANWETLVDLVTNLSALSAKVLSKFPTTAAVAVIADEVISCIGEFVKYLVQVAVEERKVPGIAAMEPDGEFVRDLNRTQAGQPTPGELACYAIVSDFHAKLLDNGEHEPKEMPRRLAFVLADGVVDRLMRGEGADPVPNDLVVDVASMTEIDQAVGGYVRDVLDFGHNAIVYHTVYFVRPETVGRLAQWLHLPSPLEGIDAVRLAGARRNVLRVRADASLQEVRVLLDREAPEYMVIARPHPNNLKPELLHYAVKPSEFKSFTRNSKGSAAVINAFDLHESNSSSSIKSGALPFEREASSSVSRPHSARAVVVDAGMPTAVIERDAGPIDTLALAALAGKLVPAKQETLGPPKYSGISRAAMVMVGGRPPATPAVDDKVDVHVTAEMPREASLGHEVVVTVSLTAEQIAAARGNISDQGRFSVVADAKLTVHVIPRRGFDYSANDSSMGKTEIDAPKAGEPAILDFMLLANEVGEGEVSVAVRHGVLRKLTLTLRATVVDAGSTIRGTVASSAALVSGADCGSCGSLEIFDRRNAGQLQYEFILHAGDVHDRFRSSPIQVDPRQYVDARYAEIENAWLGSNRAIDRFALRLETMGGQMFRQLFPLPLQQVLWRLALAGQLDGIQVHSDEPFLPWEVVFLDDPSAAASTGKGRFFGELGLCRWLYGSAPVCAIDVRKGAARYVIPHYPQAKLRLASAEDVEEPMLKKELGAKAVAPKHAEIVDLLKRGGSFDLLHFACHGQADPQQIESAALLLEGEIFQTPQGATWGKESLLASTVDQFADLRGPDGNRPLVVVNACQTGRLGYSLTGLGGFATAFLGTREGTGDSRGRAGAFIGALWSVGDEPASTFVTELYRELLKGKSIAQASQVARAASRGAAEGSWLAYAVYAHPNLRVRFWY